MAIPSSRNARRTPTERSTRRGAVAVEALIVIVMMTVVVMGTWFTRQLFAGKLFTITRARADAWNYALKGCDSSNQLSDVYKQLHEQSKDTTKNVCTDPNDCSNGNGNVDGLANDGSATPTWFPSGPGTPGTNSIVVAVDAAYTTTVTTQVDYACNPKPHNELDLGGGMVDAVNQILKIPDEEVNPEKVAQVCWQFWLLHWERRSCDDWPFNGWKQVSWGADPDPARTWSHFENVDLNKVHIP